MASRMGLHESRRPWRSNTALAADQTAQLSRKNWKLLLSWMLNLVSLKIIVVKATRGRFLRRVDVDSTHGGVNRPIVTLKSAIYLA